MSHSSCKNLFISKVPFKKAEAKLVKKDRILTPTLLYR